MQIASGTPQNKNLYKTDNALSKYNILQLSSELYFTVVKILKFPMCKYVVGTYIPCMGMHSLSWYVECIKNVNIFGVFNPALLSGDTEPLAHLDEGPMMIL